MRCAGAAADVERGLWSRDRACAYARAGARRSTNSSPRAIDDVTPSTICYADAA